MMDSPYAGALRRGALALLGLLPFLLLWPAGDPFQPVRGLAAAAAAAVLLLLDPAPLPSSRLVRAGGALAAGLGVWLAIAAVVGGPASATWGVHGRFNALVSWAALLVVGLAAARITSAEVRWLGWVLVVAGSIESVFVVWQAASGDVPVGTNGNQVMTGGWLAVAAVAATAVATLERRSSRRWLAGGAAVLMVLAMGVVGSRGSWVGLAGGLLVLVVLRFKRRAVLVGAAGLVVVLVLGAVVAGGESLAKLNPANLTSSSAASRLAIWDGTVDMITATPITGVGPGRFMYEFTAYEPLAHAKLEPDVRADQAHSLPLHLAAEAGIVAGLGLVALAVLAIVAGVRGVRGRDAAALLALSAFAAYVGQGIFGIYALEVDALGWLFGGALIGIAARSAQSGSPSAEPASRPVTGHVAAGFAVLVALACGYYVVVDVGYGSSLDAFAEARFEDARRDASRAVGANPLVDVYRVAHSDAALYLRGAALTESETLLEDGLRLEPRSYDLALARARAAAASGVPASDVADLYLDAAALYPLGVTVRQEAMAALAEAGRLEEAQGVARNLLLVVPDDPVANSILEAATQ